jgi:spermidine synthase
MSGPASECPSVARLAWTAGIIAAAVLGYELSLLRILLVASWNHFAFLVISVALLGFGTSGTALTLLRPWILPRAAAALRVLVALTALSFPVCAGLAQQVPVEARFLPLLFWQQAAAWMLYWAVLAVPFLLGASVIGLALMAASRRLALVYGANLVGSGAGALLAPLALTVAPPEWAPPLWGTLALGALVRVPSQGALAGSHPRAPALAAAAVLAGAAFLITLPPRVRVDPFKYAAHVERLVEQGGARRIARSFSARGLVEAYAGDAFHDIPFLSVGEAPPPMHALLIDGHSAGSVLRVERLEEASAVERTLMAVAYALLPPRPSVLLLGEGGGANIWLAARSGASVVQVVQPQEGVFGLLRGPLRSSGGGVLELPGVRTAAAEPRHFVERSAERFDLIQLAALESLAAGSGGMAGLGKDHLLTVEGLAACLRRLGPQGVLSACRGIQTPPRDNLKLLATLVRALRAAGAERPEEHIAIVRDYLAVCTMVRAEPWDAGAVERIRAECAARQLTPVWFPGIREEELNRPDVLPGPEPPPDSPETAGPGPDWYHHAARELFSPRARQFIDGWVFDIAPPCDDRPFFLDFCRLRSLGALREAFGDLWMVRAEIAFLFVLGTLALAAAAGATLTLAPLLLLGTLRRRRGAGVTAGYFAALGLGYLMLEMAALSRVTFLIGDVLAAAAVTLASFLVFSGAGSLAAQRLTAGKTRALPAIAAIIALVALLDLALLGEMARYGGSLALGLRCAAALLAIAPLAFLMGFPLPLALLRLDAAAPRLVPWAWGVNGFASVVAAPLATAIAMTWGFTAAGAAAAACYVAAALTFPRLPA